MFKQEILSNYLCRILTGLFFIGPLFLTGQQYQVTNYGTSEGMSEGVKGQVVQDSSGYLWINTHSGINRFDGNEFKVYSGNPNDSTTFTNPKMLASYVTDNGNLFVVGEEGLFQYDKKKDKFVSCMSGYKRYHTESANKFTELMQVDSSLYITSYIGLHEYNLVTHLWTYYDLTPTIKHKNNHHSNKALNSIIRDKTHPHRVVIGGKMSVFIFDTEKRKLVNSYSLKEHREYVYQIHNMTQLNEFEYLLSTWGVGTLKFDTRDGKASRLFVYKDLILDVGPYMINIDLEFLNDSTLLIVNKSGFPILYDLNNKSWSKFRIDGIGMKYSEVFKDREGNFWLSNSSGLTKLSLKTYEEIQILKLNARSIYWAVPDNEGKNIAYFIGGEKAYKNTVSEIKQGILTTFDGPKWKINYDKYANQYLYPKTDKILSTYNLETAEIEEIQLENTTNYSELLCTKNEYIASYPDRVIVYDKSGNEKSSYDIPEKKINKFPYPRYDLTLGKDSVIYIYGAQYIIRIDRKSKVSEFIEIKGISSITGVHDVDGVIWITNGYNGVSKFTFEKENEYYISKTVLEKDKYFAARHSTIDPYGIIWITTFSGVKAFDTKREKIIYELEEKHSLSKIDEPIYITNDFVFTPTDNSFLKIAQNQKNYEVLDIQLSSIVVANKSKELDSLLTLTPKERNIKFDWNTVYFGPYNQLSFYTKLEGWDDDWVYQGNKQSVLYPQLPYGDYQFQVKVDGPKISEIRTLNTFTIKTPWWKTNTFGIFIFGVLLLSLYLLYKWRINKALVKTEIDKKIAELELKALRAQLNPHFIFNSLNSIKRLIQKNENPQAIDYLLLFSSMIRNVLELSDKQEITLLEEIEFSEQYLKMEKLRFMDRFDYTITIEEGIELEFISIPPMILQPHLENSLWHGIMPLLDKKGYLELSVTRERGDVLISINDNGIGRVASTKINDENKDYKHNAKGSSISIDRIKLNTLISQNDIKVTIIDKMNNQESEGTEVKIQISKASL